MPELTAEQLQQIDRNRQLALQKLADRKLAASSSQNSTKSIPGHVHNGHLASLNTSKTVTVNPAGFGSGSGLSTSSTQIAFQSQSQSQKTNTGFSLSQSAQGNGIQLPLSSKDSKVRQDEPLQSVLSRLKRPSDSVQVPVPLNIDNKLPTLNGTKLSKESFRGPVQLELWSKFRFSVNECGPCLATLFKSIPEFEYESKEKKWTFPLEAYRDVLQGIKDREPKSSIQTIPNAVLEIFDTKGNLPGGSSSKKSKNRTIDSHFKYNVCQSPGQNDTSLTSSFNPLYQSLDHFPFDISHFDDKLKESLLAFQLSGLRFALERQGRVLIADDMGLGKTIQGIAIAAYYKIEWPLLIIVPASLVTSWTESILEWLPNTIKRGQINAVFAGKSFSEESLSNAAYQIHIMSYDMAVKNFQQLRDLSFQVIICDESHFIRNPTTKRCKFLLPTLKKSKRLIFLSGTPAQSRPIELYTQILAIRPKLFGSFSMTDYGIRYCAGRRNHFGWDFKGASNTRELHVVLEASILLRRLKSSVLTQLPAKRRQQIFLQIDSNTPPAAGTSFKQMQKLLNEMNYNSVSENDDSSFSNNATLLKCFRDTGLLKLPAITEYLTDFIEKGTKQKILIFAHHQQVLDGLEDLLWKLKVPFIRIDGGTPVSSRGTYCENFQDPSSSIQVALLSLTAAGVGLTLTAASLVLFAELFWNPGVLLQAEDRAHRIGQKDSVLVQYLLAKGTTDDTLWPLILRKLRVLESVGLSKNEFSSMEKGNPGLSAGSVESEKQKSLFTFMQPIKMPTPPNFGIVP